MTPTVAPTTSTPEATPAPVPGPRTGLDEGTVHDLYADCSDVLGQLAAPLPASPRPVPQAPVVILDGTRELVAGLSSYGA